MRLSRRRFLMASALAPAAVSLAANAAGAAPAAFLASIYDRYGAGGNGVPLDDEAALRRWFSPQLAELIQNDRKAAEEVDDIPLLDADPFVDAQDWDITNVGIKVDDLGNGKAAGHVSFLNFGEAKSIELELVKTPAGWRIDDILWGDASLRGLYTH